MPRRREMKNGWESLENSSHAKNPGSRNDGGT